jgi:hypothetical protein
MNRAKHAIAVVLVATALCADRRVSAAPAVDSTAAPSSESLASRLVSRLTAGFGSAVASVRIVYQSRSEIHPTATATIAIVERIETQVPLLSPFQFPLPPPCKC